MSDLVFNQSAPHSQLYAFVLNASAAGAGGLHLSLHNAQQSSLVSGAERPNDFEPGISIVRHFDNYDEMAATGPEWNQEYYKIGREDGGGSLRLTQTARVQVGLEEFRTGLLAHGSNPPNCVSFLACAGGSPLFCRGVELGANEVAFLTAGSDYACFIEAPSNVVSLSLSEDYIRHQAHVLARADIPTGIRHAPSLRFAACDYQKLVDVSTRVTLLTSFKPNLLTSAVAAKFVEDEIASLLVSSVIPDAKHDAPGVRHRAARRALDYIRGNAEELLTISGLCRAIGASQRTLEIGFQELFGMPPKVYLTMLRLHRARRELLAADRARVSVTDVATRWGFFHFGRFASAYRQQFGELPNTTIKRAG